MKELDMRFLKRPTTVIHLLPPVSRKNKTALKDLHQQQFALLHCRSTREAMMLGDMLRCRGILMHFYSKLNLFCIYQRFFAQNLQQDCIIV